MARKILFLIFINTFLQLFSQLDREHWFAPMMGRTNSDPLYQSIYLSTGEETPFTIDIFHSNLLIATVRVSRNNPVKFEIPDKGWMITRKTGDLFKPVPMGIYLKGEKPFFATLRFSTYNHAEIQTSKGRAALGKSFRAVMAPIIPRNSILNFMNSIMATEDNTQVTIKDFDPNIVFGDNIRRTEINFTLNKGQSYIVDGSGLYTANETGYIGAKISSDKPIVIANGNFNGQYAENNENSSDILMDQGVPEERLGSEFVLIKGNGGLSSNMEKAIVVATEDGTKVFVNGQETPAATLNAGDFYLTDNNAYIDQGNNHYNMYLKTSRRAYVYQMLGGTGDDNESQIATGGFNFIPPVSCFLPKTIVEIGSISENEYSANNVEYSLTVPTKLNVITQKGAQLNVVRNGASIPLTSSNGPFNVRGNSDWVTYSIANITGNIAIYSTHAVTAGISSGNGAVGYGGFFAGFSLIPLIMVLEGECVPSVKLGVTEGFASYRWLLKEGDVYIEAPGVNNLYYYQPKQAGVYAVEIQGTCGKIRTADFTFFNCIYYTNTDYQICTQLEITPEFALSSQPVDGNSIEIIEEPSSGILSIREGKLFYKPADNAGIVNFKYRFCGVGTVPDCEIAQATVQIVKISTSDTSLIACSKSEMAIFNLTQANVTQSPNVTKRFYLTEIGAQDADESEEIKNPDAFQSAPRNVYARVSDTYGCVSFATIELVISDFDYDWFPERYTGSVCDENIDGMIDDIYKINLDDTVTPVIIDEPANFLIRYYTSEVEAAAGADNHITGVHSFTSLGVVWARAQPTAGCPVKIAPIYLRPNVPAVLLSADASDTVCDDDLDGEKNVNLKLYEKLFTSEPSAKFTYYHSLQDAQQNKNPITDTDVSVRNQQIFFLRVSIDGQCSALATLKIGIRIPKTSDLPAELPICPGTNILLDAGATFTGYLWSTGESGQTITANIGNYWVDLTADGCTYRQYITIKDAEQPEIVSVDIIDNTVIVNVKGGTPPYQYSLDGVNYQLENKFHYVPPGLYTVFVKGKENCAPVTGRISVIRLVNVITPNGDGKNDYVDYSELLLKEEPSCEIFDRFGTRLFSGNAANRFIWDGSSGATKVSTGTYWCLLRWREPNSTIITEQKLWILVKNRN